MWQNILEPGRSQITVWHMCSWERTAVERTAVFTQLQSSPNLCIGRPPAECDDARCCVTQFYLREDQSSPNLCIGRPPAECDDARCCVTQFWPPRGPVLSQPVHRTAACRVWWYQMLCDTILTSWWWAQLCSKHVQVYNKLIIKKELVH